jgi:signal transduction histidine kinase
VRRKLDKDERFKDIPFIFLTAMGQLSDRLQGLHAGADDYVVKPFEPSELEARVRAVLRRVKRERSAAARTVEELKNNILANITHELRTPMAVVRSTLELALEGAFGDNLEQEQQFLSRALKSTDNLRHLVDDLLLMATIDSRNLELFLTSLALRVLFQPSHLTALQTPEAQRLVVHPPEPPHLSVVADRRHLKAVLNHLVENALKFSPKDRPIVIRAQAQGEGVAITVTDQGPGIGPEDLPRIFDRFYQVDMSSTRPYPGLGCGLYIVREMVQAHLGHVEVESEVGRGSRFTVWLPQDLPEGLFKAEELADMRRQADTNV